MRKISFICTRLFLTVPKHPNMRCQTWFGFFCLSGLIPTAFLAFIHVTTPIAYKTCILFCSIVLTRCLLICLLVCHILLLFFFLLIVAMCFGKMFELCVFGKKKKVSKPAETQEVDPGYVEVCMFDCFT
jgi:hypothetical protein